MTVVMLAYSIAFSFLKVDCCLYFSISPHIMAFLCPLESFPCFIPLSSLFLCKFPAVDRHPYLPVCSVWGGGEPLLSLVCVWAVFVGVPVSALQTLLNRPVPTLTIL